MTNRRRPFDFVFCFITNAIKFNIYSVNRKKNKQFNHTSIHRQKFKHPFRMFTPNTLFLLVRLFWFCVYFTFAILLYFFECEKLLNQKYGIKNEKDVHRPRKYEFRIWFFNKYNVFLHMKSECYKWGEKCKKS